MRYRLLASLKDDMNSGWVWITNPNVAGRSVVKIQNQRNRKWVFCEALMIDHNYRYSYKQGRTYDIPQNQPVITVNAWYRSKLGLKTTNTDYDLRITPSNDLWGKFFSCIQHPQVVVRLATWLGTVSIFLGIFSLVLSASA